MANVGPPCPPGTNDPVFARQLAFRTMLGRLSGGLGQENLRQLKNLCADIIPLQQRETMDSAIDVFDALIQKQLLTYEKVEFLSDLLKAADRLDLIEEYVKPYVDKQDDPLPEPTPGTLEFRVLKAVAEEVGRDWKMLARYLGLDEVKIQSIHQSNFGDLHEAALQALLRWQTAEGTKATPRALKRALTEMKLMSIVHKHFQTV